MSHPTESTHWLDQQCINTIRTLAMDAVERAKSGHPGAPMGDAAMAYVLWGRFLHHNPANPTWPNRDRFILSNGHASMLLYSLLYLTGYGLELDDLQQFRQWGSRTPGHPEYGLTPGVELTTGPLGQGVATGVGMAMAERHLAARFNRPGYAIVDHYTYAICSDGDLMEGVASEAASLAGHLGLGKLIYLYDDNRITIEGHTSLAFSEDVAKRFEAYGWQVLSVQGDDLPGIAAALRAAQADTAHPSLLIVRTHIAWGSPNAQDTAEAHGAPLGAEEVALTKAHFDWPQEPAFYVPSEVLAHFRQSLTAGAALEQQWQALCASYAQAHPELAQAWEQACTGSLPEDWEADLPTFDASNGSMASRAASGQVIQGLAARVPTLIGGSADLAPSTNTLMATSGDYGPDHYEGRNLHFGVREHAMGAILSGMALHGGVRPYGATFLIFSDYMRPAIRLAALSHLPVIYIFTHDSIALGEDGPTHQPVEHLAALRAIPHLIVLRPADATEVVAAWKTALVHRDGPVALILSRQRLPYLDRTASAQDAGVAQGAYILAEASTTPPRLLLLASGSEVHLTLAARQQLEAAGVATRVVSIPSWELFAAQPDAYRHQVLPATVSARLAVEAATPFGWERFTGDKGAMIGITTFGASAPGATVLAQYGFTVDQIVARAQALLRG